MAQEANHAPVTSATLVRHASLTDLDLVLSFDATDEHMARSPRNTAKRLAGKAAAGDLFLAFVDGRPAGYARVDMLWPESCPLLSWVFVVPEFRGSDIHRNLREFVYASLRAEGFNSLLRSACTERPHMIARLTSEGLTPAGRLTFETGTEKIFFWHLLNPDRQPLGPGAMDG